jgi:hypothetical protein
MQGYDVTNQRTVIRRDHEERLADAQHALLLRSMRDQRTGARFAGAPMPVASRPQGLRAWFWSLVRTTPAQAH